MSIGYVRNTADGNAVLALAAALRRRSLRAFSGWIAGAAILAWFCFDLGLSLDQFERGVGKLGEFLAVMWPPSDGGVLPRILRALGVTFAMAFAGTVIGAAVGAPLGVMGAKTIVQNPVFHFLLRRFFDVFRGVPALVWGLILISALGLGPLAGVLALALEDAPRFAKLFAEAIENADQRPSEAVRAAGGGPFAVFRFGLLPQTVPIWTSQVLYFLERNFRAAAILGIVGAGGIGFELSERIRIFAFDEVLFIIILYLICVAILDFASAQLRRRMV
jgi:phosphonate transport system permease protein